jgi:hypothetical protein
MVAVTTAGFFERRIDSFGERGIVRRDHGDGEGNDYARQ